MFQDTWMSLQSSVSVTFTTLLTQLGMFLPKFLAAILILVLGTALAKWVKSLTIKLLEALRLSRGLKDTPIEAFLRHAEVGQIEEVCGTVIYWLSMIVVLQTSVTLLGLQAISGVLDKLLGYVPSVLSAIIVLFVGVLLAGFVESLVKGAIQSVNGKSARLFGKVSSYLIMVITVMAAVAELKIASQFISTLFTGFVYTLTLGLGLAFGLGSKDVVSDFMQEWYQTTKKELK
jgi:small-conductance mechanosensitive channel